ncbi:cytochrome p450-like protein [Leishmania major strain Friedlin]|uniref:Cytochrome p450-like protein n=1 Tax=Leishmania major TaxID=5664 RepID=E9ACY6_LEIMA|nr:cytochrome p450-like protein [Leishmania major strain Friedlin]CAG9576610.1 cytochrome_p450-like_protein [Leishmania major strain Friedlin]CBZ12069.1 cytochrome p450-like protein [Leishmania major strain Friedlin]|eukprot:XP_003721815.1 cytochrome p450-like protein [Leishmania major strain Friedlin]
MVFDTDFFVVNCSQMAANVLQSYIVAALHSAATQLPSSVQPYAMMLTREDMVSTTLATAIATAVILYTVITVVLPVLRMDFYLSKLPTIKNSIPFLGHALLLAGPSPWSKMSNWSLYPEKNLPQKKKSVDGPQTSRLVTYNVAGMRVIYINEPRLLRRVLLTHQRNYRKALAAAYKHFMCLLGTGLVTSEDEQWKKGRLLLSHAMRIDILDSVPEMAMKAVDRILLKLDAVDAKNPSVDLNEEYRHMTLQVISESALSLSAEESDRIFPALYLPIVHECNKRVWAPWRAYMPFLHGSRMRNRCLSELNKVLRDIICRRWEQRNDSNYTAKPDILALCISQIDRIDEKMIVGLIDDVKTILLAGHETSAALLTFATYEVLRHPEIRQKILEEATRLFDPARCTCTVQTRYGPRGVPALNDVRSLVWTPAVLRETLRRHSVVPLVMRYAAKDDVWPAADTGLDADVRIPAGCTIAVGIEGVHNNPDVWNKPEVFDPTRFIDAEIANDTNYLNQSTKDVKFAKKIDPYAFIPFINGPRNCLGQHLSMIETQVALAYMVLSYDLTIYRDPSYKGDVAAYEDAVGRHHDFIIPQVPHDGLKVWGTPNKLFM